MDGYDRIAYYVRRCRRRRNQKAKLASLRSNFEWWLSDRILISIAAYPQRMTQRITNMTGNRSSAQKLQSTLRLLPILVFVDAPMLHLPTTLSLLLVLILHSRRLDLRRAPFQ
jgi:integral membrane sensor domain MASE1